MVVLPAGSEPSPIRSGQSRALMSQKRHPCVRGDRLVVVSAADLAGNDLKFVLNWLAVRNLAATSGW